MKTIGAILLITGTAIGAGMLALPVLTAEAGLWPTALLFLSIWALTLFTALLLVEVNLSYKKEVNLISMCKATLGERAAGFTWVLFLALLYSLTSAYLSGSGSILNSVFESVFGFTVPYYLEPVLPLTLFGLFVVLGTAAVDRVNRILIAGLVAAYIGLVVTALPDVMSSRFTFHNFGPLFAAVPVAVTSFGFHIIIPSVVSYLHYDARLIKKAVIVGSLVPLAVYLLWELVILGVVPLDATKSALLKGAPITEALADIVGAPWVVGFGVAFSFFAIVTSFLGVSLSLFSFLKDGLGGKSRLVVVLTFLPPLIFVELFPGGFIGALRYAGVIVALISGVLPALMAYKACEKKHQSSYRAPGRSWGLGLAILFSLLIIISDIIGV